MIAHGNHEIAVDSYLGYDYLGEYLASCGYAVVSVDQNACNMLTGENAGRAVLLLEHIGWLLDRSDQRDHPLYGLLDRENIAIAGHSRGGDDRRRLPLQRL
jgi:predicted dienelactone hydrolase